jgi:hypothetical protein
LGLQGRTLSMRLLIISIASVGISFLVVFGLRLFGMSQDQLERKHAFLENGPLLFSIAGDSALPNYPSLQNMIDTKKMAPGVAWLLPLYIENDRLVVRAAAKSLPLEDVLATFPKDYYFFHLMENKDNINHLINESIKKFELENRVLLFSPYRNVLLQFRTLRPQWLTALSTPEANLFFLSHKLWLETLAPFPADFLWLDKNDSIWLRELSTKEIFRRKKFLICEASLKDIECKAKVTDSPTTYSADQTSS